MGNLQSGGGTSAVAASAHAGCRRFRLTDPFLTRKTRRALAAHIGSPDTTAGIPEARWMRAVTFERLVHDERFVSELLTKTIGQLRLARPAKVARVVCNGSVAATAKALADANLKATREDTATMITALGIPYLRLEDEDVTAILPDFAIVAPRLEGTRAAGSWLIVGDAKDYERVRSRIDDTRLLKGFLQVALAAESAAAWSRLPRGMQVHQSGALAVPRNAFLQPEAMVEVLDDHREEVRERAQERLDEKRRLGDDHPAKDELADYVAHLEATFDPASCVSCSFFAYCRSELRASEDPAGLLVEIGVPPRYRPGAMGIIDGTSDGSGVPVSIVDQVTATVTGRAVWQKRGRTDPVGLPGTVYVALAKSDAAALGVHGIAIRRPGGAWRQRVFLEPQAPATRRAVTELIGAEIESARAEGALPLHLVVPDAATADLLVSGADSVAGVELSRMRWQRDLDVGRPALTVDGTPATLAPPLKPKERLGVAFLLEADRARASKMRTPIVDLRTVLAGLVTPGGPAFDAGRLDYLVRWASSTEPLDHRAISDEIAGLKHTPGARLSNEQSDAIHAAHRSRTVDPKPYRELVRAALAYKQQILDDAEGLLAGRPDSRLRSELNAVEAQAQEVWWRRVSLEALDLVRFDRTTDFSRNVHVRLLDADQACATQLAAMTDHSFARDRALDAGVRELAHATVVALDPTRLNVHSRRFEPGTVAVALHLDGEPLVERATTTCKTQGTSFKFGQLSIAPLTDDGDGPGLAWSPTVPLPVAVGDELVLAAGDWFKSLLQNGHELNVARPGVDTTSAPLPTCTPSSYAADPEGHRWCCRPHAIAEADTADWFAHQRATGKMNPETWPPLIDEDRFDADGQVPDEIEGPAPPDGLTADDLD